MELKRSINPKGGEASSNYVLPDPAVERNQRLEPWIVPRQQERKKEKYSVRLIDKGCSREERGERDWESVRKQVRDRRGVVR